jgi:glycosyltransferase involved in cell wall biosynthesis
MRIAFLTSTPLDVVEGSGTFVGVSTLAAALRRMGVEVEIVAPGFGFPIYTARRWWFNHQLSRLRWDGFDLLVGFDLDGYSIAGRTGRPRVASIKGVIADELRFERGLTRFTMSMQAAWEAEHVRRADLVMTTSLYAAHRIQELYRSPALPRVVPEAIDLAAWRGLLARNPAAPQPEKFVVLTVCRFYPRKRLPLLLAAAAGLRHEIPALEFRIVGDGPERGKLHSLLGEMHLQDNVRWLGNLLADDLAREYNRCDVFCLPSVQEGFGIVFLEAMAAGKPIVAANAAAVPEVVPQGLLVEPESAAALAEGLRRIHGDVALRARLAEAGKIVVERFDAATVAALFLSEVRGLIHDHGA